MIDIEVSQRTPARYSSKIRLLTIFAAALLLIGSTYAVNMLASPSVEYGQGIYKIVACDSFVNISLQPTATVDGSSYVGSFKIMGLDVRECAGATIQLKLFTSGSATALTLFATPANTNSGDSVILSIAAGATLATAIDDVTLIDPSGQNIEYGDSSQSIDYDDRIAEFTISFSNPKALMSAVDSIVLESTST